MNSTPGLTHLSPSEKRDLLKRLLREKAQASRRFPMSSQQQGLWHAYRRDPNSTSYNVFLPTRIRSPLCPETLRKVMQALASRHHSLRTTFSDRDGDLVQIVHASLEPEFRTETVTGESDRQIRQRVLAEAGRPFDLQNGPLLRLAVFRSADDDHVVVATTHHIITDFWSLILVMQELRGLYPAILAGETPDLPAPSNNYADFVARQNELLAGPQRERLRSYWRNQTQGVRPILDLPVDYVRPTMFTGRAGVTAIHLDRNITASIRGLANRLGVTINTILFAALQVFLNRITRQSTFLIGSPFSGRASQRFENTIGLFSGVLPMRAEVSDELSFGQLVGQAAKTLLDALDHEGYPFAEIVKDASPDRDTSRGPLIQTLCTFENSQSQSEAGRASFLMPASDPTPETHTTDVGGMIQESFAVDHPTCHYDLEFAFDSSGDSVDAMICYCADLFAKESVTLMARNFEALVGALAKNPDRPLRDLAWPQETLGKIRPPASVDSDANLLPEMLRSVCERFADGSAVRSVGRSWTYAQLDRASRTIADRLHAAGLGNNDIVPVIARNGPDVVPAILGVISSGAAVCPIDADGASVNIDQLIRQTSAKWVIADAPGEALCDSHDVTVLRLGDLLDPSVPVADTSGADDVNIAPDDSAYVIFTSGSTGVAKGVMIPHAGIANTMRWRRRQVPLRHDDKIVVLMSHQFDAGFGLILATLTQGACLVWPAATPNGLDLDELVDTILRQKITVLAATPGLVQAVVDHTRFSECVDLRQVWTGGETMPRDLPAKVAAHSGATLRNFYGPTEASVEATCYEVPADHDVRRSVPIGRSIDATTVRVVDQNRKPVARGIPGELAITGPGVAIGYLGDDALTEQRFVSLTENSADRTYLTGDLGRENADGLIEFMGRIDDQVKVRGYRIELAEIEQDLAANPNVTDSAACVVGDGSSARLIGFIVCKDGLAGDLTSRLPRFKRCDRVHVVDSIPRNTSGKVDRRRLARLGSTADVAGTIAMESRVPSGPVEVYLAQEWSKILDRNDVAANENFFDSGGSSLQAAMLTSRLSEDLGVRVPPALLFDLADVTKLARRLVQLYPGQMEARFGVAALSSTTQDTPWHPLIAAWQPGGDRTPMFMVHPPGGIVVCYRQLAQRLSPDRPLFAIRSRGLHGDEALPTDVASMATDYVAAIAETRPGGPLIVGGWSLGGLIAIEIAKQLRAAGRDVRRLILLDTTIPDGATELVVTEDQAMAGREYGLDLTLDQLSELPPQDQLPFLWEHAKKLGVLDDDTPAEVVRQTLNDLQRLFHHHVDLANHYRLDPIHVPVTLFRPTDVPVDVGGPTDRGWSKLADEVTVVRVPGHHHSMLSVPHVDELAKHLA